MDKDEILSISRFKEDELSNVHIHRVIRSKFDQHTHLEESEAYNIYEEEGYDKLKSRVNDLLYSNEDITRIEALHKHGILPNYGLMIKGNRRFFLDVPARSDDEVSHRISEYNDKLNDLHELMGMSVSSYITLDKRITKDEEDGEVIERPKTLLDVTNNYLKKKSESSKSITDKIKNYFSISI